MNVTYVTGNANKAKYFESIVGKHIGFKSANVHEIQSLDLEEVVAEKAKAAYAAIGSPVLVEDTSLVINSLGKMPGPLIKWFLEEIGLEKICRLADISSDRSAIASAAFAFYDGKNIKVFAGSLSGTIPDRPLGNAGFGWNPIFTPKNSQKTMGQMDDAEFKKYYVQIKPFERVKEFLNELDKK